MKKWMFLLSLLLIIGSVEACKKDSKRRVNKFHRKAVGDSAHHILSNDKYKSLTIEVLYMTGFKPTDQAVADLKQLVIDRCNKSKGITVVVKEIPALGYASYSISDITDIEDKYRTQFTYRKDIAICFTFVDGPSVDSQGSNIVLGQAFWNTSMVIYEKDIADLSGGFGEPARNKLESVVINHELGHILGLVNVGTTTQNNHEDGNHPAHCINQNCLMFWQAETGDAVSNLFGSNPVPVFDANCIADLQANGGK